MAKKKKLSPDEFLDGIDDMDLISSIHLEAEAGIKEPDRIGNIDYHSVKNSCDASAALILDSLIDFYLDDRMKNLPYIQSRINDDKHTISDMLFNMKTSEHAIIRLLEIIDDGGALNARNFEMLSKLQSAKMEIVKHYESVKTNLEKNYKSLKYDFREIQMTELQEDDSVEGFGHKALLDQLNSNFDEVQYEEIPSVTKQLTSKDEEEYDEFEDEKVEVNKEELEVSQIELPPGVKLYTKK